MAVRILVVEDDRAIQRFVQANLKAHGYEVMVAGDGEQALELASLKSIDLVLLDIAMPVMDGVEFCRSFREWSSVPIIVLSAQGQDRDIIRMLELGADEYVVKPFSIDELLARVKALLRRVSMPATSGDGVLTFGDLKIDPVKHQVTLSGKDVMLTPTEFRLLNYLASHVGKAITHAELLRNVWGPEYGNEREYLRVFIGQLRRKVEPDPSRLQYIITVPFLGYRFQAPMVQQPDGVKVLK